MQSETSSSRALRTCIEAIYMTWKVAVGQLTDTLQTMNSRTLISNRIWLRCRKSLERFYQLRPQETYCLLITEWYVDTKVSYLAQWTETLRKSGFDRDLIVIFTI